jgi:hypothetical protein
METSAFCPGDDLSAANLARASATRALENHTGGPMIGKTFGAAATPSCSADDQVESAETHFRILCLTTNERLSAREFSHHPRVGDGTPASRDPHIGPGRRAAVVAALSVSAAQRHRPEVRAQHQLPARAVAGSAARLDEHPSVSVRSWPRAQARPARRQAPASGSESRRDRQRRTRPRALTWVG